ncbi:TIGR04255 family protein [Paraburkholderia denitrificans]|uniref:TIGR04255 family protein n=1 Tax=Paraburkholderia denitrificans TaxID=694025 RepID=A0ABW0J690_9BURK
MYEDTCYRKSFLAQVIAKIDFASPLPIGKAVPPKLVNSIVEHFSIVEPPQQLQSHQVIINEGSVQTKQATVEQWTFFSKDRGRQLTLSPAAMFVNYSAYSSYEETKQHFGAAVEALEKCFPDTIVARFGLRYINQIEVDLPDATDWAGYFSDSILAARAFFRKDEPIARLINIAELNYDDVAVRFQHGLPNPDFPASIKRPFYVLDFDAYVSQAHSLRDVLANMDAAHGHIQELFERSITERLREKMDARPVQQ